MLGQQQGHQGPGHTLAALRAHYAHSGASCEYHGADSCASSKRARRGGVAETQEIGRAHV